MRNNVYHPDFAGSFSLKSVLPALVGMGYKGMPVSNGSEAGMKWGGFVRGNVDFDEKKRLKHALLDYCRQDTLGLVRLLDKLQGVAAGRC